MAKAKAKVVELIASQLALPPEVFQEYRWKGRVFKYHLAIIGYIQ